MWIIHTTNKENKMKKLLLIIGIACLVSGCAGESEASIQKDNVEALITTQLSDSRASALENRTILIAVKAQLLNINTNFLADIDTGDRTKLIAIFADLQTAIDALNAYMLEIDTAYPSIQE